MLLFLLLMIHQFLTSAVSDEDPRSRPLLSRRVVEAKVTPLERDNSKLLGSENTTANNTPLDSKGYVWQNHKIEFEL